MTVYDNLPAPNLSPAALSAFRKIVNGDSNIDGEALGREGLVYRLSWKENKWSLTNYGVHLARRMTDL